MNVVEPKIQSFKENQMDLTVITPKGTADGYSIGVNQDVLMSETFNGSSILK